MNRAAKHTIFLVTLTSVLATFVRIHFSNEPLWIDELHTAWTVNAPIDNVIERAAQGNQMPLYFLVEFAVCQSVGFSEISMRLLSVMCSVLCIPLAANFVWNRTHNSTASSISALLIAFDTWSVFYGSEARPYAMLQLLSLIQLNCFLQEFEIDPTQCGQTRRLKVNWSLTIATLAMLLTHLASLFLIAAEIIVIAIFVYRHNLRRAAVSIAIAPVPAIVFSPTLIQVLKNRTDWSSINQPTTMFSNLMPMVTVYLLVPLLIVAICRKFEKNENATSWQKILFPCLVLGLGPILLTGLLGYLNVLQVASIRFVSYSPIIMAICTGLIVSKVNGSRLSFGCASVVVILAIVLSPLASSVFHTNGNVQFRNENWKSVVSRLNENPIGDQPTIFLFANLVEDHRVSKKALDPSLINYLQFPLDSIYPLNRKAIINPMATITKEKRWHLDDIETIRLNRGASIVMRAGPDLAQQILDDLNQTAIDSGINLKIKVERQQANDLIIASITVVD